eukprot:s4294_g1.t1
MDLAFGMMSVFYLQEYPPEQPISAPVAPSNPSAASSADGANIRPVQAMRPEGTHLPYGVAYADDIMESWGVRVLSVTEDLTPADYQVNISEVYHRLAAEFPVKPLPRRKPQWQSVSAFFQRAAGEALLEDPGTPTRERPHSRSRASRATVLLKSASFCRVVRLMSQDKLIPTQGDGITAAEGDVPAKTFKVRLNLFRMNWTASIHQYGYELPDSWTDSERKLLEMGWADLKTNLSHFVVWLPGRIFSPTKVDRFPMKVRNASGVEVDVCHVAEISVQKIQDGLMGPASVVGQHLADQLAGQRRIQRVGKRFYKNDCQQVEGQPRVISGYSVSLAKLGSAGPLLQLDVLHKPANPKSIVEVLRGAMEGTDVFQTIPEIRAEWLRLCVSATVVTNYNFRVYRIKQVHFDMNPSHTFQYHERRGGAKEYTYADYLFQYYGKSVTFKNQPILEAYPEKAKEKVFLLPEFCCPVGVTDEMRKEKSSLTEALKLIKASPMDRHNEIVHHGEEMEKQLPETLNAWGCHLGHPIETLEVEAKQLEPLQVCYEKETFAIEEGELQSKIGEYKTPDTQLLGLTLLLGLDGVVRSEALGKKSIPKQVIQQIHAKFCGPLWQIVQEPEDASFLEFKRRPFMILGIDVYRTFQGARWLGICASLDKVFSQYYSMAAELEKGSVQKWRTSLSVELQRLFRDALSAFTDCNDGILPETIVVYRASVNEAEWPLVDAIEVQALLQVLNAAAKVREGYVPKIVMLGISRKSNIRIFKSDEENIRNPHPGTVVDDPAVCPGPTPEFYMISQAIGKGSAVPTHYSVLLNKAEMPLQLIENLTNRLCLMYYNVPTGNGSHAWRPASATAPKRGANVQRKDGPSTMAMRRRPQSAPALLRNDMQGLVAQKTHEDPVRQRMEDVAVQKRMEWLKREGRCKRDFIEGVDVMSDPILFDLKVKHNSAARAKSATPKTAAVPSTPGSKRPAHAHDKTSVEKLRGLCSALAKDTHSHCTRLQIPPILVEGKGAQLLFEKLDAVLKQYPALRRPEDKLEEEKHDLGASFAHSLQGLIGAAAASAGDLSHPLVRLAYFLDGGRPGRLHLILEVLDRCRSGMLQSEDFCLGVELLGFATPDFSALWGMLDDEGAGQLPVWRVEEKLVQLIVDW